MAQIELNKFLLKRNVIQAKQTTHFHLISNMCRPKQVALTSHLVVDRLAKRRLRGLITRTVRVDPLISV